MSDLIFVHSLLLNSVEKVKKTIEIKKDYVFNIQ